MKTELIAIYAHDLIVRISQSISKEKKYEETQSTNN